MPRRTDGKLSTRRFVLLGNCVVRSVAANINVLLPSPPLSEPRYCAARRHAVCVSVEPAAKLCTPLRVLLVEYCTLCPKKTTLMLHTIDSTHINRFRLFLAEMLLREYAIEW